MVEQAKETRNTFCVPSFFLFWKMGLNYVLLGYETDERCSLGEVASARSARKSERNEAQRSKVAANYERTATFGYRKGLFKPKLKKITRRSCGSNPASATKKKHHPNGWCFFFIVECGLNNTLLGYETDEGCSPCKVATMHSLR